MDLIKEAFDRVREDINFLKQESANLRKGLIETRERMIEICDILKEIEKKVEFLSSTQDSQNSTLLAYPSTHKYPLEPLKPQNLAISIGNQGVSTDRQTDRQTHRQTQNKPKNKEEGVENRKNISREIFEDKEKSFENALEILNSLDDIKKEIRLKFKRLTEQEILIFSTIYQIQEEKGYANYKLIAEKLKLTESSVRDYVGRLIKKGIPVEKKKINNKLITLSISEKLKKIAPLSTILQLRDL